MDRLTGRVLVGCAKRSTSPDPDEARGLDGQLRLGIRRDERPLDWYLDRDPIDPLNSHIRSSGLLRLPET